MTHTQTHRYGTQRSNVDARPGLVDVNETTPISSPAEQKAERDRIAADKLKATEQQEADTATLAQERTVKAARLAQHEQESLAAEAQRRDNSTRPPAQERKAAPTTQAKSAARHQASQARSATAATSEGAAARTALPVAVPSGRPRPRIIFRTKAVTALAVPPVAVPEQVAVLEAGEPDELDPDL
jgi:hypothetical protein